MVGTLQRTDVGNSSAGAISGEIAGDGASFPAASAAARAQEVASLLERAKQLTPARPQIRRNVPQLLEVSRRMAARVHDFGGGAGGGGAALASAATPSVPSAAALDAHRGRVLLATRGFDAEQYSRLLFSVDLRSAFEPSDVISDRDLDALLRLEHDSALLRGLEDARRATAAKFVDLVDAVVEDDWAAARSDMLEELADRRGGVFAAERQLRSAIAVPRPKVSLGSSSSATPSSSASASVSTTAANMLTNNRRGDWTHASRQAAPASGAYAAASAAAAAAATAGVHAVDAARLLAFAPIVDEALAGGRGAVGGGDAFPWLQKLSAATRSVGGGGSWRREAVDSWELLVAMTGEPADAGLSRGALAADDDAAANRTRHMLVAGALRFLERQFRDVMQGVIAARPQVAQLGGQRGTRAMAESFSRVGGVGGPWAAVYYCLRCGDVRAAADAARDAHLDNVVPLLECYERRMMPPAELRNHASFAALRAASEADEMATAVLHVLRRDTAAGRALPSPLRATVQDFVWFRLSCLDVREVADGAANAAALAAGLLELQTLVQSDAMYRNFADSQSPLLYYHVLLLAQLFREAVDYVVRSDQYFVLGVHAGVALRHIGLLAGDQAAGAVDTVLEYYAAAVDRLDVDAGLMYRCLIADASRRRTSLRDVLVATSNYVALLEAPAGAPVAGLRRFLAPDEFDAVGELVAAGCEEDGMVEDAVKIYLQLRRFGRVLALLTRRLAAELADGPRRAQLLALALDTSQKISSQLDPAHVPPDAWQAFVMVLKLAEFFDKLRADRLEDALALLDETELLPRAVGEVARRCDAFERLSPDVARAVAVVAVAAMEAVQRLASLFAGAVQEARRTGAADGGARGRLAELRGRASALVYFAGRLQYRLPADAVARIVRIDAQMQS